MAGCSFSPSIPLLPATIHRDDSRRLVFTTMMAKSRANRLPLFRAPLSVSPCRISALLFQFCPVYQVGQLRWRVKRGSKVVADYTRPPFSVDTVIHGYLSFFSRIINIFHDLNSNNVQFLQSHVKWIRYNFIQTLFFISNYSNIIYKELYTKFLNI